MPGSIGFQEIVVVLIIALIIFGPKRLPELGRSLGKGIREFRGSISGDNHQDEPPEAIEPPQPSGRKDAEGESVVHDRS